LKRRVFLGVLLLVVAVLFVGCIGTGKKYTASGIVVDLNENPIAGVDVILSKGNEELAVVTTGDDGKWVKDGLSGNVVITPGSEWWDFSPTSESINGETRDIKFVMKMSTLETHADGEGRIVVEPVGPNSVRLTGKPTDPRYSFFLWAITTLGETEEFEEESITVTLDNPVKAKAYFDIADRDPYLMGSIEVVHSFPMALEEDAAAQVAGLSSAMGNARTFDAPVGDSFVQEYAGEQRIVMFDFFDYDTQVAELEQAGWKVIDHLEILNAYLVEPDPGRTVFRQLDDLSGISSIDRNGIVRPFGVNIPNDELYPYQWHYHQIRLAQAWSVTTGDKNIRIAVVDTGIDPEHTDLKGQIDPYALENLAETDFTADKDGIDYHGHGTHVAGTIGAATNNGYLVSGVMWDVTILPVKVFDASGRATNWTVVQGMLYAAGLLNEEGKPHNPNPVDVINMSLGGGWTKVEEEAVALIDAAGVIMVAATGNEGTPFVSYPAAHPQVIAVGAVGKVDVDDPDGFTEPPLTGYSNYGSGINVVAPGAAGRVVNDYVWSTYPSYLHPAGREYAGMGGTSMACPHVSGVVGLMLANGIAKEDIMDVLQRTAMEIHLPTPNIYFGHGLVNAYWAVNALDDGDLLIIQGIRNGNQIEIANSTPLPLKGGQFRLDMTPGEYQFIAWIDVNKNGLVDAGDYYVETPVLEIEVADSWTWTDTLTELPFDLTGDEAESAIAALRGTAEKIK
jgi:serine protease